VLTPRLAGSLCLRGESLLSFFHKTFDSTAFQVAGQRFATSATSRALVLTLPRFALNWKDITDWTGQEQARNNSENETIHIFFLALSGQLFHNKRILFVIRQM